MFFRYQYHGSDKSLLYKYVLSPLAEKCLVFLPMWMAPNLVTTIGLSLTTASYLLLYFTVPGMVSAGPANDWVFPTAALGLFVYQTLDNMDGKQVCVCVGVVLSVWCLVLPDVCVRIFLASS